MGKMASAAVVREPGGPYTIESVELDDLRANEVYVRVEAAGVCHTDANMQVMVPMPAVVGHEGVGVVEEVGAGVDYVKPGDRVIISWPACGVCPNCLTGKRYICDNAFPLLFGGQPARRFADDQAERRVDLGLLVPAVVVRHLRDRLGRLARQGGRRRAAGDPRRAALRGHDGRRRRSSAPCRSGPPTSVLMLGAGGVGQAAVMAAHMAGAYPDHRGRRQPQASGTCPRTRCHPHGERQDRGRRRARAGDQSRGSALRFRQLGRGQHVARGRAVLSAPAAPSGSAPPSSRRRWAAARTSCCRRATASSSSWAAPSFPGSSCRR